jgi:beta-aspartyl-peptidase (threonine type)
LGVETYANNKTCAVACTGIGEPFMKLVTAYDISARMMYKGESLGDAVKKIFDEKVEGGVIGMDREGNIVMEFNTKSMLRGYIKENGKAKVFI